MIITPWIHSFRLRTLPLALSSTVLASFIAASYDMFQWKVLVLASITTILLQILSNMANDYGDFVNKKDNAERIGPERMVQSGKIKPKTMFRGLIVVSLLTFVSGIALILVGTNGVFSLQQIVLLLLGIASIAAAIKYTVGKKPYGYSGYGDIFVFTFFGIVGVLGTFFLHTNYLTADILLPASTIGFLSVGVLNLNNLRDYEADKNVSKKTMVVIWGVQFGKIYHTILIASALFVSIVYILINYNSFYQFLFLVTVPLFIQNISTVWKNKKSTQLNSELKKLAMSTLLFSILFGIGCIIPK